MEKQRASSVNDAGFVLALGGQSWPDAIRGLSGPRTGVLSDAQITPVLALSSADFSDRLKPLSDKAPTRERRSHDCRGTVRPARLALAGALALSLAACSQGVLAPVGPISEAERTILLDSLAIMLAIVVPVALATLAFAWWFRASNDRAIHLPNWSYSGRLEFIVWSIPAMVVLFIAGIGWVGSHDLDPARRIGGRPTALEVQVVALDWKWLFIYPGQGWPASTSWCCRPASRSPSA